MNSVKKFMKIFDEKRSTKSWQEMTAILKECDQYFKNVPACERGVILSILFDEQKGLLTFLKDALEQLVITKDLEGTIIQTLHLLIPIMEQFADDYKPYIALTMSVLTLALTIKSTLFVKYPAAKAFIKFIEVFKLLDLDFNSTINNWIKKMHLFTISERSILLHVMSVIASNFPQTEAVNRTAKIILRQLIADYTAACEGKKKSFQRESLHIESLQNILRNFPPSINDTGSIGRESLYGILKNVCKSRENQSNKKQMLAVINLLSEHLSLFDEFVYEDYEFWHTFLKSSVNDEVYEDSAIKAMRNYYRTMGTVLGRKETPRDKQIFLNFRDSFIKSLANERICSNELRLTVYGFSQIVKPCKNYLATEGMKEMYFLIVHRTIPLYFREENEVTRFEEIADYQEALSRIIRYLENVSIDHMRALTTLCSLLIKRFPELSIADQDYATSSLIKTIINIRYTKEILYQDFITNIIYEGVVWSCSHMLSIDAEYIRDSNETTNNLITYKNYVALWRGLLNPEKYSIASENSESRGASLQMVVNEIVATCMKIINTLNLNVTAKNVDNFLYDVKSSPVPENPKDFRIFLNLVDLYVEILPSIESFLWTNIAHKFIHEIIKKSYKSPMISGFYKMARVTLVSSGVFIHQDSDEITKESFDLILQYLWNTIDSLSRYPQELQISCLQLVLNIPGAFVARVIDRAIPVFRISLTLGLTNYEIATTAMTALEHWRKCLSGEFPKKFISQIIPCLAMFLESEEYSKGLLQNIEQVGRKKMTKRNIKRIVQLVNGEQTVEGFQRRILLFFGSLDNETMMEYIHRISLKTDITWSKKDLLKYPMPFPDQNLNIDFDSMLSRIIELALRSGDRSTRMAACEVLHTIVAFMLGKTVSFLAYDKDRFSPFFDKLCPALLRLGCDSDDVIMQLCHPLMMQLTHWLSSRLMLDSLATKYLIDAIFDGLSDENNSSLNDVSGIYLAEFVHWSIKQSTEVSLYNSPTNIDLTVRRIIDFALDPSSRKRIAAAIAFNHLYRIIRENDEVVNIFWLLILHAFVKSLDGCCDARIDDSLKHIERVLVEKSRIFNKTNPRRVKPTGFSGVKITDALNWIFEQCGSLDKNCRNKCMAMFVRLSRTINTSSEMIISEYLKIHDIRGLNKILYGNISGIYRTKTSQELSMFQRTLDLYVWIIRNNLIEMEILFTHSNPDKMLIFELIVDFILVSLSMTDPVVAENEALGNLRESVKLRNQRCEAILTLFDFILVIIDVRATNPEYIPDNWFNEHFFSFVSICLTKPEEFGFNSSNIQLVEELPAKLEILLKKLMENLSPITKTLMTNVIANEVEKIARTLFEFGEMMNGNILINEKSVKALLLLQKCGILKMCKNCDNITTDGITKINKIFDLLKSQDLGKSVCFYPKFEITIYLQSLVELLLFDYDIDTMKDIIKMITNNTALYRSDMTIITHGEYFFNLFKTVLTSGFLKDSEKTLNLMEESLKINPDSVLRIIEAIVLHLRANKHVYHEIIEKFPTAIIMKFHIFERSINNFDHRRDILLNIYSIVIRLRKNKLLERDCDLYRWLLRELVCNNFKYKIRLLRDFLICLTDETLEYNPELTAILSNLKNERKTTNSEDITEKIFASTETIDCFQNLLKLLPITRSMIVLDALMNFSSGIGELLCEDNVNEYLKLYYSTLGASNVLKSLEVTYKRFMTANNTNERFDVLRYFLLPALGYCTPKTVEAFYQQYVREIYAIIIEEPTLNIDDKRRLFVTKIGCYNLMERMFANLSRELIDNMENSAATAESENEKFSQKIFRGTLMVRQWRAKQDDDREIVRLLHCSAYKCCIAIVSTTKCEKFYVAVFGENRGKNQLIWENIINVDRKYDLRQTSKEYPKQREKLISIRKIKKNDNNIENHYSYVKSYDLATSTLNENIYAYDLNAINLIPRNDVNCQKNEVMSVNLEIDDLNEHECMPLICGFLKHILGNELPFSKNDEITLPKWMSFFRVSMSSQHTNVRLFLLKIVLNTQAVFLPYAKFFIEPVINTIYQCLRESESLNYVITDSLIMLIEWREKSIPRTEREINLARSMFAVLMDKSVSAPTRFIVKYNLSIIEMIVDAWHECLVIPDSLNNRIASNDRTSMKFVLIFLTNKMAENIVQRNDVWHYILKCLTEWKIEEESVMQSYEAAGLMLKYSTGMESYDLRKSEVVETASGVFRTMQTSNPGRLVKCVYSLCKPCCQLVTDFFQFVSSAQLRVEPTNIAKCLEIFSLALSKMKKEDIVKELSYMRFNNLLENKVICCEKHCLKIVDQLIDVLDISSLFELVKLVAPYANDEILEYRQLSYDIFAKLYKKCSSETTMGLVKNEMMNISMKILLAGLLDPDEDAQKISLDFWSDVTILRGECFEKFLDILDTYNCGVEKNFLEIIALLLLESTAKSVDCENKMFEPLHNSTYSNYDISISWKSRNYQSRIPLFAPSLASQLNRRFTQYSYATETSFRNDRDSQENYFLRMTNVPEFEKTYSSAATTTENPRGDVSENGIFAVPKNVEVSKNKISRRFLTNWSDVKSEVDKRQTSKEESELKHGQEFYARQRGRVKLYRKYRIGDFPDIEISHLMILRPMQELVKRDPDICKHFVVTLLRSLIAQTAENKEREDYRDEISSKFTKILMDRRENAGIVSAILEILFCTNDLECPWSVVAEIAKNDGLYAQGAILIERNLIGRLSDGEPPAKRARFGNSIGNCENKERWIELASFYESMNELDVALGIFKSGMFTEELHLASYARASNDWASAEGFYRKAHQSETDERTKRHCLQGTFECLSRLGKWKKLQKDIDTRINENFNNILFPDSEELQWMAPWIFRTHIQRILESHGNEKFLIAMKTFLNDTDSYQRLKDNYGEETAIILCNEKPEISRDFLNGSWEKIRQQWLRLNPSAVPLRSKAIIKLRGIHDIDSYLRTIGNSDLVASSQELLKHWKYNLPSIKDDLLAWDTHTSYRSYFSNNLMKIIGTNESQDGIDLVNNIRTTNTQQILKLIDCSLNQNNGQLTKKYLLSVEQEVNNCQQIVVDEFEIDAIKYKFLEARTTNNPSASLKYYSSVWQQSKEILNSDTLSAKSQICIRQILSQVSESLAQIAKEKMEFLESLATNTSIIEDIFSERIDFDNIVDSLYYYSFQNLQKCCTLAPGIADCYLRLSKYCYERILSGDCNEELSREFVRSTLRAMSYDSEEATYYFPCLLKDNILSNDEIRHIFIEESANVETWRFLIWQTQLLSNLGTKMSTIVIPIVRRMMDVYPNAMVYSLRLVLDTSVKLDEDDSAVELKNFLADKQDFNKFMQAMEYVVSPKLHIEYHLREFLKTFRNDTSKAIEKLMKKLYPIDPDDACSSLQGDVYQEILAPYESEIENYKEMPIDDIEKHVIHLLKCFNETMKKHREKNELKYYSPWLNEYVGGEIEVPGQYNINEKPSPRYHAKIVKIERTIKVMQSIRKPIRITILATDGKNYRFLVKFGEDLRLDQRVEQIFAIMNDKLKSDPQCSQRRLSIDTYQVFPLSGSLGLIQWIDGTRTLREYINFSMDDNEKMQHRYVEMEYEEWIKKAAPGKFSSIQYKEALVKYNADDVRNKMQELINKINGQTLRKTFVRLSTCIESFMSIRRNFTSTYATMCIGQWILGIGDRHTANTLITIESGRCIGIDFGSAFGGGLGQSVPELMPFRLTPQIIGLIEPFKEYNSMGPSMIHVLRALKNSKGSLLACLDVVTHEQLNWQEHVNKLSQDTKNTSSDVKWLPETKLKIVCKKLDGVKPSTITLEQLAEHHSDEKYFPRYTAVVGGTDSDGNSKRSSFMEDNLSPEEQVQCLIEQATDLNVLGRTYVGWAPWL